MTMGGGMVGVARGKSLIKQIIRSQRLTKIGGERSTQAKLYSQINCWVCSLNTRLQRIRVGMFLPT